MVTPGRPPLRRSVRRRPALSRTDQLALGTTLLALVGLLALGALTLTRIYAGPLATRLLIGAALGAVAVSTAARRLPTWAVGPLSVLGLASYTLFAVRLSAASAGLPGDLRTLTADAVRNGIPRMFTAMIPIEPQPDTILVPLVATWLAGLAAAELLLRTGRALVSLTPPTLLYAAALLTVGPNATTVRWQPVLFVAIAAAALAVTGSDRSTRPDTAGQPGGVAEQPGSATQQSGAAASASGQTGSATRRTLRARLMQRGRAALGAVGALAVVLVLGAVAAPLAGHWVDGAPADPRRHFAPPKLDNLDESPLARLSGWSTNPDQRLFDATVRVDGGTAEPRIRLAVLSDYDGVTWRIGATYRSAGRVLTGPPALGDDRPQGRTVEQSITIGELAGRLVPAVDTPQRVDGVRIAYDQNTRTLIRVEGLSPQLHYTVTSRQPGYAVNALPTADVPTGDAVARYLDPGAAVPPELTGLAEKLAAQTAVPYERALGVEQFLAEHYTAVPDAPTGHAYPNLKFFLFGPRNAGGQRGSSEQFAASFAALARLLGLPTRVVVGFRTHREDPAVRGRDAFAWPEVLFSGVGWVPFDPMPRPDSDARPLEEEYLPRADPTTPPPPSNNPTPTVSTSNRPGPSSEPPPLAGPDPGPGAGAVVAVGAGSLLLLVIAVLVTIVLVRGGRRRRLATADPPTRVAGAWWEVVDALRQFGRPAAPHLAVREVAEQARLLRPPTPPQPTAPSPTSPTVPTAPEAPAVDELARLVNLVTFAPTGITADDAQRASAEAAAYLAHLRGQLPWWRLLLWAVDPRPLWWARQRAGQRAGQRGDQQADQQAGQHGDQRAGQPRRRT